MEGYYRGRVSSVDEKQGFVKVTYPQEGDTVSEWLPLFANEYNMLKVGDIVATVLDKNGEGVCFGKIYSYDQPPPATDGRYEKDINGVKITEKDGTFKVDFGDASITYSGGTLTLSANKINLNGYTPPKG